MAVTRLGVCGPAAAYAGFVAKAPAIVSVLNLTAERADTVSLRPDRDAVSVMPIKDTIAL